MIDRDRPLPLSEVLEIVERRRRQRARTGAIAGSALAVGAAGLAGLIVVGLQTGPPGVTPAAPPPAPALVTAAPTTSPPVALPPPFDAYRDPDFLANLADAYLQFADEDQDRVLEDAAELAEVWGLEHHPAAKAVAVKAEGTGTGIDPTDPRGADELVGRFEGAGYTERDADELARVWSTDPRTAKIVAALVLAAN